MIFLNWRLWLFAQQWIRTGSYMWSGPITSIDDEAWGWEAVPHWPNGRATSSFVFSTETCQQSSFAATTTWFDMCISFGVCMCVYFRCWHSDDKQDSGNGLRVASIGVDATHQLQLPHIWNWSVLFIIWYSVIHISLDGFTLALAGHSLMDCVLEGKEQQLQSWINSNLVPNQSHPDYHSLSKKPLMLKKEFTGYMCSFFCSQF